MSGRVHKLSQEDRSTLVLMKDRVLNAPPVMVRPQQLDTWCIFTDGACEAADRTGGVGGVIMSPDGRLVGHFASSVPESFMKRLLEERENPIYELEIIPVFLATDIWCSLITSSQVVFYLDNDAARAGLIRMRGATEAAEVVLNEKAKLEVTFSYRPWYGRVPTSSNIADGPSRGDCAEVLALGSQLVEFDWNIVESLEWKQCAFSKGEVASAD